MTISELINVERDCLEYFLSELDVPKLDLLIEVLSECKGAIVLSGVGKSGLVAQKIAMTMTSVGTRALFLSAMDALHGDIGIIQRGDVFLAISKSGESDELLNLIPTLRNRGVVLVALVNSPENRLAQACDHTFILPCKRELCPYNVVPTISSTTQMIFGDLIAIALMQKKQFSLEDFLRNHPAGAIGKRITLKVQDLMITGNKVPRCHPDDKLVDTLVELSEKECGCVLVIDEENKLQGIFTDGDLRRALMKSGAEAMQQTMTSLMTVNPRTIEGDLLAVHAMKEMEGLQRAPITVLPVIDKERSVQGVVKMHDILQSGI